MRRRRDAPCIMDVHMYVPICVRKENGEIDIFCVAGRAYWRKKAPLRASPPLKSIRDKVEFTTFSPRTAEGLSRALNSSLTLTSPATEPYRMPYPLGSTCPAFKGGLIHFLLLGRTIIIGRAPLLALRIRLHGYAMIILFPQRNVIFGGKFAYYYYYKPISRINDIQLAP